MSSWCSPALESLDESLALLREGLEKLKAAKSVDFAEVIEQLKTAVESARIVRELVWSELPRASWQSRRQLDALIGKIQDIQAARTLEQLRSRLLALATELERGSIVHRRALRVTELNRLREQAINELRSQDGPEGTPQTLPGPQADQWIEWACGLQEPQDAESLQTIRNGFAHLDDFVANLETNMWVAAKPSLEGPPQTKEPSPATPELASEVGFDPKDDEKVADLMSAENPPFNRPNDGAASSGSPGVQSEVPVLADAFASLDRSLAWLCETLERLKAAQSVDFAEVVRQLRMADESARVVRELVCSELPEASWQNREELDAVAEKIHEIRAARTLEQMRSRLLALATELERGSIVHRRALRVNELNQMREQAINELRSQAAREGTPETLPGPDAGQWMEWACGLQDPQDAESLQALQNGFAHLDDFVANLEPNMWVGTASPTSGLAPEATRSSDKTPAEPSRPDANRSGGPVASPGPIQVEPEAPKFSGRRDEPRMPDLLGKLSLPVHESNTLTPNDVTPPRTQEEIQRMMAREQALLASMMGLVSDPVGHLNRPVERPFSTEVFGETSAPPVAPVGDPVDAFDRPIHRPFSAEFPQTSAGPAITADAETGIEGPSNKKWRVPPNAPALIVLAALLVSAVLGAILWKSRQSQASNGLVSASERKAPDQTESHPLDKVNGGSGMAADSAVHTSSSESKTEKQSKPPDRSVAVQPSVSKASPLKQARERDTGVTPPPPATPREIAAVRKEDAPPKGAAEVPDSIPGGLPGGVPNSVANIVKDIPVAVPNIAGQKVRVSSGVAQGLLIHEVAPKYPPLARQAHIQGTVVLQAVIGKDGTVQNLHVLSGHPMLNQSALDAVRQWRYKPYYVNGQPVEADTQINVNFRL